MREKFGFPSAGEMRPGNGRSHHDDAENATKETKSVKSSSPMVINNTRDLPKSPLRDSTNSPLRSASKEIRVSMSANVNQWRSERAEKNVNIIIDDHEYTDETERGENGIDADERSY